MTNRVAIVIDSSGSMGNLLGLFSLTTKLTKISWNYGSGCLTEKLKELSKDYDEIYFFTDGLIEIDWNVILNNKIMVVKVEP